MRCGLEKIWCGLPDETTSGTAKRRITAVTKEDAKNAIAEGKRVEKMVAEVEELDATTDGLDKKAGAMRKEVDVAFLPATLKAELRARVDGIQKKANEAKKAALAKRVDQVLNDLKADVESAVADGTRALVLNVDIGADSKASQKVMNAVKKIAPEIAFLGLSEEEPGSGGKLMAFSLVPDALVESGLKADEWVRGTLEVCGGRGGGRPVSAQGQAPECSDIDAVFEAANSFAASKVEAEVS